MEVRSTGCAAVDEVVGPFGAVPDEAVPGAAPDEAVPAAVAWGEVLEDALAMVAQLRAEELEAPGLPGEELAGGVATARRGLSRMGLTRGETARLMGPEVSAGIEALGKLRGSVEACLVTLALEAAVRGLHSERGLGLVDWLAARCPWAARSDLVDVDRVVRAARQPLNGPLVDAVATGAAPPRRGAVVAKALAKLSPVLDPEGYAAFVGIFTQAACTPTIDDRGLGEVIGTALRALLDDADKARREKLAFEARSFSSRRLGSGLTRFTIDAPEEDAALLHGIVTSRLAKPSPDENGPDPRSGTQRRYDAFTTVLGRGNTCPEGTGTMPRATVMVTIGLADLLDRVRGAAGFTTTGEVLSPGQVRTMACEAEIIPVVLGGPSEILDLGRAARLASPAQVKALRWRDKGCSFPGCTIPPEWCIAHHIVYWVNGGTTDLEDLALLCERHHSHVHEHDLRATVTGGVLTWHL